MTLITVRIGIYVMIGTHLQGKHGLQSVSRGPVSVIEYKYDLVFMVEDIINAIQLTVNEQRMIPYRVTRQVAQASTELLEQTTSFDKKYHVLNAITAGRRNKGIYEVGV